MEKVVKHNYEGLTTYYTKKGRKWWVESQQGKRSFSSIEAMVKEYPALKSIPAIEHNLTRRAAEKADYEERVVRKPSYEVVKKKVDCYYCEGTGKAYGLPCTNCDGQGFVELTAMY